MSGPAQLWPTAATRVAGVIGDPVRHSLSPVLHNAAYRALGLDWVYAAFEVPPGRVAGALAGMRSLGIEGLSVTMPHKATVARFVDELTPAARRLGAVNTVIRHGERLLGDNTDGGGFLDSLRLDLGVDPAGRRCLVLGAGGAARAVVLALADAGAAEVAVWNRTRSRAAGAASLAGAAGRVVEEATVTGVDLVVNATPAGMDGVQADLPVELEGLGSGQVVVDLVYHPQVTPLVAAARDRGATASGGLGMLLHQAGRQVRAWTGMDPPLAAMSAAALSALGDSPGPSTGARD